MESARAVSDAQIGMGGTVWAPMEDLGGVGVCRVLCGMEGEMGREWRLEQSG
jgi:hypothetical protein